MSKEARLRLPMSATLSKLPRNVPVTAENRRLTIHFPDAETRDFRWLPLVARVRRLTDDLRGLDKALGWLVRAKALGRIGQEHGDR